jgi:hypothetical protein
VSYGIKKHTVIVLDNASIHQSKAMRLMQDVWAKRQLFIFYLPPYPPHLNPDFAIGSLRKSQIQKRQVFE